MAEQRLLQRFDNNANLIALSLSKKVNVMLSLIESESQAESPRARRFVSAGHALNARARQEKSGGRPVDVSTQPVGLVTSPAPLSPPQSGRRQDRAQRSATPRHEMRSRRAAT